MQVLEHLDMAWHFNFEIGSSSGRAPKRSHPMNSGLEFNLHISLDYISWPHLRVMLFFEDVWIISCPLQCWHIGNTKIEITDHGAIQHD